MKKTDRLSLPFSIVAVQLMAAIICIHPVVAQTGHWVSAYYAGYQQSSNDGCNNGRLPAGSIDYTAVTHIIHFAVEPAADGTILRYNSMTDCNMDSLVDRATAAGKKAILCIGGRDTRSRFVSAVDNHLSDLINNLLTLMAARGYDGVDIDWEPLYEEYDLFRYQSLIAALRDSLNQRNPSLLLTVVLNFGKGGTGGSIFVPISQHLDQINLIVNEAMSGWQAWAAAHNVAPEDVPSTDAVVQQFINAGVPALKLGIDTGFHGPHRLGGVVNRRDAAEIVSR